MAMTTTVRHHSSVDLHHACSVEASLVSTDHATEVYLRLAPVASATSRNACEIQTRVLYDALDEVLHGLSAGADHVVIEKAFFRNLPGDHDDFSQIRCEFYRKRGLTGDNLPAITCLGQPPCRAGVDLEMQIYAIIPTSPEAVCVETLPSPCEEITVKRVEIGHARHLFVNNANGRAVNGEPDGFRQQSDRAFRLVRDTLAEQGASFADVLRAWVCVPDIEADYAELNSSRNTFFADEKVERLPASTAIGGLTHPATSRCALDVYALLNPEIAEIEVMEAPTLNEASEYGSAFSRGIKLTLSESAYLFVSGTPGVDEKGKTVREDNARAQMERMLLNVEELLRAQGASWSDLTHAVTYLRSPEHLELFEELCEQRGIDEVPHSIVCADLCRPELVSEMEAVAVIPAQ
jgi:enamine deaminase RidA (YjgF/YER057c/UK114 family)